MFPLPDTALRSTRCAPRAALHALRSTYCAPRAALHALRSTRCGRRAALHTYDQKLYSQNLTPLLSCYPKKSQKSDVFPMNKFNVFYVVQCVSYQKPILRRTKSYTLDPNPLSPNLLNCRPTLEPQRAETVYTSEHLTSAEKNVLKIHFCV